MRVYLLILLKNSCASFASVQASPGLGRMLWRGLLRRCPHCGNRHAFFARWFVRRERCVGCGLRWERNYEGFMLGAMAMSFLTTGGALIITMGVGVTLSYPAVALLPVLVSTVGVTLLVGVFGYPISYTLWQAIDLYLRPVTEDDGEALARSVNA